MKYNILATGSKGNATIVNDFILLDCGISYRDLKPYLYKIKAIFISHKHTDHLLPATIKQIAFNYPTIKYLCYKYDSDLIKILLKYGVRQSNIFTLDLYKNYTLSSHLSVRLHRLYHDVLNVAIEINYKGERLVYATDTASLEGIEGRDFDYYLIEANYKDEQELERLIQQDYDNGLEYSHYERVRKTHLSEEKAIEFLRVNMKDTSKFEFMHKHITKEEK